MANGQLKPEDATWWDHHELTYWLWALLRNAESYLDASRASSRHLEDKFSKDMSEWQSARAEVDLLSNERTLAAYHFVTTMGVLIRVLKRAQHLFPKIQPPYSRANHLLKEGKIIRDMIEHAYGKDGYLAGGGKYPGEFIRADGEFSADATSTIIKDDGHWLGNRLCVEMVVGEVQAIKDIADTIKAPSND